MAFAKFEVGVRLDKRWERIADRYRGDAKAVYMDAILYSAEMLVDGRVSRAVLLTLCELDGLRTGRAVIAELTQSGFLDEIGKGQYLIVDWERFHSSREDVEAARLAAAERKRRSRGQMSLDVSHRKSHRDDRLGSQRDEGVTRAHVRAGEQPQTQRQPQPAAGSKDLEESRPPETAAAEPSQVEAPRPTRIAEVLDEFAPGDTDSINHIEPLAVQLPSNVFEAIVQKVKSRRADNPAGLLRKFLGDELRQRLRNTVHQANGAVVSSPIEKLKREQPEQYVVSMAKVLDEPDLEHYLASYVNDEEQRIELRDRYHDERRVAA